MSNNCQRYYELRNLWEAASQAAAQAGATPAEAERCADALQHLRAHAEVCPECIEALFGAFPETAGMRRIVLSVEEL